MPATTIRSATEADVPLVLQLIHELAAHEKLAHDVTATERDLHESLFGDPETAALTLGGDCRAARLRPVRMGGSRLERTRDQVLSEPGRGADE
jgi:hypothetical protein